MLFNSYPFIFVFLPVACLGAFCTAFVGTRVAIVWLTACSVVFYGVWSATFIPLLLGSAVVNYVFSQCITKIKLRNERWAGPILFLAISVNLLVLGYFKYFDFFIGTVVALIGGEYAPLRLILPLGISFFTFTQIGFLIDTYNGRTTEHSLLRYMLFVTYFPYLIAGPITNHRQFAPQIESPNIFRPNIKNISLGITIFILALAKKLLLADSFSEIADPIFASTEKGHSPMLVEAWIGALAYPLQLYFDFSAYSEMAIGVALLFNIYLPLNFNSPFKATNVIEYWQRWHMSLTRYIYEYLYTPITIKFMRWGLGRSKVTEYLCTVLLPTLITFLIIGIWHGANWTFIVFGLLHGTYMLINYAWHSFKKTRAWKLDKKWHNRIACLITFISVVIAAVFFRAESVSAALTMTKGMLGLNGLSLPQTLENTFHQFWGSSHAFGLVFEGFIPNSAFQMNPLTAILGLLVGLSIVWCLPNMQQIMSNFKIALEDTSHQRLDRRLATNGQKPRWGWQLTASRAVGVGCLFFVLLVVLASANPSTFLYYQF
jgi:alginate O-acetyltransferase complex protein AlgI